MQTQAKIKKFLKLVTPPAVVKAGQMLQSKREAKENTLEKYQAWWKKFSAEKKLDPELLKMMNHYFQTKECQNSSLYWNYLSKKNIRQIADFGFDNFKQTVATNYYTWIDGISGNFGKNIVRDAAQYQSTIGTDQLFKKHQFLSLEQSILFNSMTALLYAYIKKKTQRAHMAEEASYGNSLSIEIEGKKISQDIINSIIEFDSIIDQSKLNPNSIIEIGAGSGRTAEFFLKAMPSVKYFIVDIPPALYVSQTYLSKVFPSKKVFKFRPFEKFSDISSELEGSDLAFFSVDQIKHLPNRSVDLFMAIDCLHEMKPQQIDAYFKHADRIAKHFYFKAWHNTSVPFDNEKLEEKTYPIPSQWKKVFHRDCYVPGAYFEGLYKIVDAE